MESVWHTSELADAIIQNDEIIEQTHSIVADILAGHIDLIHLVENMAGVLTNTDVENREKGMRFYTKILKELPTDYLTEAQIKFISKFYTDRLKDHHSVVPAVIEGYLTIVDMSKFDVTLCGEFLTILFREVSCQSQLRHDRYNIYCLIKKITEKGPEHIKQIGPDFVYGVISAIDGERDPRNLMFLFTFLPSFVKNVPLGHLVDEMFDIISCYYPIDFHPSPDDPTAVTRQELADALCPCLCAVPEFGEQCLVLLVEKLDSNLRLAKIDSLKLLAESFNKFKAESYTPFLKTLWASIHREITHKTDEELKATAHKTLYALVAKLATSANTDQAFENFVKGILISMQTAIAESTTVAQFVQATKVLLTTANASKPSCLIITKMMISSTIAFYGFKTTPKLKLAALDFLGDLYDMAKHWELLDQMLTQASEIPQVCLTAVSEQSKEYQVAGFKTLIRVNDILQTELVVPFVEILIHNIQNSQDNDLLGVSVATVHAIARKYPELIMSLVVKDKCDLENLTRDKEALQKRLSLLSNLASIDDFTQVIIVEMLKIVSSDNHEAVKVVAALNESISNASVYSNEKVTQIESDHGLIDSILNWLYREIAVGNTESLSHGYTLIANTITSLPAGKQLKIISKHAPDVLKKCEENELYFLVIESLYSSLQQNLFDPTFEEMLVLSLKMCLKSDNHIVRTKACGLLAHFLNKAEFGQQFELLYELLKVRLAACRRDEPNLCPRLIILYGWLAKALIMRGCDAFSFWLEKIVCVLSNNEYCKLASEAIHLIMTEYPDYLSAKYHCRVSILYRQRMFHSFSNLADNIGPLSEETKESYLLSWAYVLDKAPKSVLNLQADKITPLIIDSLEYSNDTLLCVMLDTLCHLAENKHTSVSDSLQTVLPKLVKLTQYTSMNVRINSLQCLYDIANSYRTSLLLPYKQDILLDLAPSLDDKKRLVRNMAVRARTRWFLVGAPGEEKDN